MADTLLSQLLTASWAHRDDRDPVPPRLPPGADVVLLTCSEPGAGADGEHLRRLFALPAERVHVVRAVAARVPSSTGEVAHSVAAALTGTRHGEVLVLGHAGCRYLGASEYAGAVGGRFDSVEESVRASVRALQATRILPAGTAVHGLVVEPDGTELTLVEDGYWAVSVVDAGADLIDAGAIDAEEGPLEHAQPDTQTRASGVGSVPEVDDARLEIDPEPLMARKFAEGSPAPGATPDGAGPDGAGPGGEAPPADEDIDLELDAAAAETRSGVDAAHREAAEAAFERAAEILRERSV